MAIIKSIINGIQADARMHKKIVKAVYLSGASTLSIAMVVPTAYAQNAPADDEIIVTGIRASLERAQDIKRNSDGVVDSISAEDIGKFPDTNLAESLQRITGVSINRVNGEGSQVTVRGFGPEFNLVTLNGRTIPGADAQIAGGDFNSIPGGASRAFDFSNLASEAVSGLDVYKTGSAAIPSGGIGATIDIKTARPLDNPGFNASIGVKGVVDTSVVEGSDVTPEINGVLSWTDPSEKFGVSLFGSYQERNSAAPSGTVFRWQTFRAEDFLNNANFVGPDTVIQNAPTDPDQLVGIAIDSRLNFSELERERTNLSGVVQFAPNDNFTITADALYAKNDNNELRSEVANWFGAQFTEVIFDTGQPVATAQSLTSTFINDDGEFGKDVAFGQDVVATRDELTSFGLNLDWQATDNLRFILDGHVSSSEVSPNARSEVAGDVSRLFVATNAASVSGQTQTFFPGQAPVQFQTLDGANVDGVAGLAETDLGTTFQGASSRFQDNEVNEIDFKTEWRPDDDSKLTVGFNYRDQENQTLNTDFQQFLGFFGNPRPDVAQIAPGVLQPFCVTCEFDDFPVGGTDETGLTFRPTSGDALIGLFDTFSPIYEQLNANGAVPEFSQVQFAFPGLNTTLGQNGFTDSNIQEKILSLYAQYDSDFDIGGREARFSIGLRYEDTDLTSTANFSAPTLLTQTNDNDFILDSSTDTVPLSVENSYENFLPHANIAVDIRDDVVFRAAYSNTIARAGFGQLSAQVSGPGAPSGGSTALGAPSTATQGNPQLIPIESDNFDVSLEWYYDDSSFVSVGAFHKVVDNFIGQGTVDSVLFPNLFDPSSGVAGSRSGDALQIIQDNGIPQNDQNLFLLTSLVDSLGAAAAAQVFIDTVGTDGVVSSDANTAEVMALAAAAEAAGGALGVVSGNSTDAPVSFTVSQPVNSETATLSGIEIAGQHFFGETGFGLAGSYTLVSGNDAADLDVTAPVGSTQFALTGLSDTANITAIYEKHGISARVSWNWRDEFLASANRGGGFDTPIFVQAFDQFDANVSYDVTDNLVVSLEAINITGENFVTFGRSSSQVLFAQELAPRYLFGARYKF